MGAVILPSFLLLPCYAVVAIEALNVGVSLLRLRRHSSARSVFKSDGRGWPHRAPESTLYSAETTADAPNPSSKTS